MDREGLLEALTEHQKYLRDFMQALQEQHEEERPGRDFDALMTADPKALLRHVESNFTNRNAPLAAIVHAQVKLNEVFISYLRT